MYKRQIPKFIWFAFEPLVTSDPVRAIEFAKKSKINLVSEYIARRLVDADELDVLASGIQSRSSGRLSMMKGMLDGMEGLSDLEPPKNWDKVYASLKEDDGVAKMATEIAQQFGDIEATMQLISILNNIIDFGMGPQEALSFPRAFHFNNIYKLEKTVDKEIFHGLKEIGHNVEYIDCTHG